MSNITLFFQTAMALVLTLSIMCLLGLLMPGLEVQMPLSYNCSGPNEYVSNNITVIPVIVVIILE